MNKTYEIDDTQRIYKLLDDYRFRSSRAIMEEIKDNILENDAERKLRWK